MDQVERFVGALIRAIGMVGECLLTAVIAFGEKVLSPKYIYSRVIYTILVFLIPGAILFWGAWAESATLMLVSVVVFAILAVFWWGMVWRAIVFAGAGKEALGFLSKKVPVKAGKK